MATASLVTGICKSCDTLLCISTNEWLEFTPSYSTYENADLYSHPGLEQVDQNRPGSKDSELEGCTVQALVCKKCHLQIGLKCVVVAPQKEQYRYSFTFSYFVLLDCTIYLFAIFIRLCGHCIAAVKGGLTEMSIGTDLSSNWTS